MLRKVWGRGKDVGEGERVLGKVLGEGEGCWRWSGGGVRCENERTGEVGG